MARPYRLQGENIFYHVTSRGDDRKKIFISMYDHAKFLDYLLKAKEKFNFYLYAYVLMSNHYHLLIETTQPNLSKIMQYINSSYTTYYNIKRKKVGHVFQGRFKSIIVDKDSYLLELTRYVHLNPVRAKMVVKPEEYRWSSYAQYISKSPDKYIDKTQISKIITMSSSQYKEFVEHDITGKDSPLKKCYGGFILGSTTFIKEKLKQLKEQVENSDNIYKQAIESSVGVEDIAKVIKEEYGTDIESLRSMKNKPVREKKIAIYLMKRITNMGNREIGSYFNISSSAVSKIGGEIDQQMLGKKKVKSEIEKLISRFSA